MLKRVKPEGWHNWDRKENEQTVHFAEYNNHGNGAATDHRVPWSRVLTEDEAKGYTITEVLGGWNP